MRHLPAVSRAALAAALTLIIAAASGVPRSEARTAPAVTEVRGMWVLRTSLVSPAAIATLVDTAAASGINALFVQVRGRGDAYYDSAIEPRGALLSSQPASFDPLALVIRLARPRGIAVHAWVNVNLVSDTIGLPASPDHVIRSHPDWLMLPRALAARPAPDPGSPSFLPALTRWTRANLARVEGLYVSPIPLAARAHAVAVARDLARRYALDGLHLDYVRYPTEDFDYSRAALAEFRASLAAELPAADLAALDARARTSPLVFADRFPERWFEFRRARVTWLVDGMASAARAERPGILISAAVLPDAGAALARKLQDWPSWASRGIVDALCPMAYAEDRAGFRAQLDAVHRDAGSAAVWTGIGAYRLTARETAHRVREARRAGAAGVLLFSYDSVTSRPGRYLTDVGREVFSSPGTENQP